MRPMTAPRVAQDMNAVSLLGLDYLRLRTANGGELYLTRFGAPFREQLAPENWYASDWFAARRTRLLGTSTIYRLPTKSVRGVSLDLVVRFSRVGEEVPIDAPTRNRNVDLEFNSPFEEFALIMELRAMRPRIFTKKPLAIFVTGEPLQLWQTGRLESKIAAKLARHPEVQLDILRQYILLYGWIEGLNAVEVFETFATSTPLDETFLADITRRATLDLQRNGFRMADIKPQHIVLRTLPDGSLLRQRNGQVAYALVDYELLESF
jgi:hypothetical protein